MALFQSWLLLALFAILTESNFGLVSATTESTYSIAHVEAERPNDAPVVDTSESSLDGRSLPDFGYNRDVEVTSRPNATASGQWILELNYGYRGPEDEVKFETYILDYQSCRQEILDSPIVPAGEYVDAESDSLVVLLDMDVQAAAQRPELLFGEEQEPEYVATSRNADPNPILGFCAYVTIHYKGIFVKFHHTKLHLDLQLHATLDMGGDDNNEKEPSSNAEVASSTTYEDLKDTPPEQYLQPEEEGEEVPAQENENTPPEQYLLPEQEEEVPAQDNDKIPPEAFGELPMGLSSEPEATESSSSSQQQDLLLPIGFLAVGFSILFLGAALAYWELRRRKIQRIEMLNNFLDVEKQDAQDHSESRLSATSLMTGKQQQEAMLTQFFDGAELSPVLEEGVSKEVDVDETMDASASTTVMDMSVSTHTNEQGRRWVQAATPMVRIEEEQQSSRRRHLYFEEEDIVASWRSLRSKPSLGGSRPSLGGAQLVENESGVFLGTDAASVASQSVGRSHKNLPSVVENESGVFLGTDAASVASQAGSRRNLMTRGRSNGSLASMAGGSRRSHMTRTRSNGSLASTDRSRRSILSRAKSTKSITDFSV